MQINIHDCRGKKKIDTQTLTFLFLSLTHIHTLLSYLDCFFAGGSLILAEVMSKLRGIDDAYKRLLAAGPSAFAPFSSSSSSSPSSSSSSLPSPSQGAQVLAEVLRTWQDIDRAINMLPRDQDASVLRYV